MNKLILLISFFALPALAFDPSAKFKALIVRSAGSDFLNNAFIEKCFQSKELPQVSAPKIQMATDPEIGKNLYLIHFNGRDLHPQLVMPDGRKVELEKSSDQMGYVFSVMKPLTETDFTLQFELQNSQSEFVQYSLQIGKNEAHFIENLSESQAQRVCIRNQAWLGLGASAFLFDQKVEGIEASSKFTSITPGSLHLDVRYYLNSQWGILGSYKSAPGKIKTESTNAIDSNQFRWSIYELAFQWRNQDWMKRWNNLLIYPYLRGSYQVHQMPGIFITDVGDSSLQSFGLHQLTAGAGMNVFDRKSRFFEAYVNFKRPISSSGQDVTPGLHFDGAVGIGTVVKNRFNLGLFWHGHSDQFQYSVSKGGFENSGKANLVYSSFDLKLGWCF